MLNWCEKTALLFLPFENSLFCVNSLLPQIFSVMTLSQLLLSWSWSARLVTPYSGGHLWVFWLADLSHYPRVGIFYFTVSLKSQLWSHASLHCPVHPQLCLERQVHSESRERWMGNTARQIVGSLQSEIADNMEGSSEPKLLVLRWIPDVPLRSLCYENLRNVCSVVKGNKKVTWNNKCGSLLWYKNVSNINYFPDLSC